jgi:hypothetical protein
MAALVSILASGVLPATASSTAGSPGPPRIVPWHLIGNVGLGYSRARVEYTHGRGTFIDFTRETLYDYDGDNARTDLSVVYSNDWEPSGTVTAVWTTSARYRTKDGLGVGTRVPFQSKWKGFTRHINSDSGYWWYRYAAHAGRPVTVLFHVSDTRIDEIGIYRGRVNVPLVTRPGDPYYKKGQLPLPVLPVKK